MAVRRLESPWAEWQLARTLSTQIRLCFNMASRRQ